VLDAVLLSDLHLGWPTCQVEELLAFLHKPPATKCLILNGDVLEGDLSLLTPEQWRVLVRLRELAKTVTVIWVAGNHDPNAVALAKWIGAVFVSDEYMLQSGECTVLCVHGHRWDSFFSRFSLLIALIDWVYLCLLLQNRQRAVWLKQCIPFFWWCVTSLRRNAVAYARSRQAHVVVCGHVHYAELILSAETGTPTYCNLGCWTEQRGHYATVYKGVITLCGYSSEPASTAQQNVA
jgi:UDP-2,3-diacylglucosamine pyrophosphatase LpxH